MKTAHDMPSSRPRIQIRYRHTANCSLSLLLLDLSANLLSTFRLPSVNVPENLPNIKTDAPPKPLKWI